MNLSTKPTSADSASICDREFRDLDPDGEFRQLVLGCVVVAVVAVAAWLSLGGVL